MKIVLSLCKSESLFAKYMLSFLTLNWQCVYILVAHLNVVSCDILFFSFIHFLKYNCEKNYMELLLV